MARPRLSDLRYRVALETRAQIAAGGAGGTGLAESFTTGARVWARVELIRGGRYQADVQTDDVPTHRITIRFREDFTTWRYISDGSRRWRVVNAGDPDGRRVWVEYGVTELMP